MLLSYFVKNLVGQSTLYMMQSMFLTFSSLNKKDHWYIYKDISYWYHYHANVTVRKTHPNNKLLHTYE